MDGGWGTEDAEAPVSDPRSGCFSPCPSGIGRVKMAKVFLAQTNRVYLCEGPSAMSAPLIAPDRLDCLQAWLRDHAVDAWLAYDFHQINPIFGEVFGTDRFTTRRAYVLVPASGDPELLLHFVDQNCFPAAAKRTLYRDRLSLIDLLGARLSGLRRVAMEYSPNSELPTIAYVDAGTIELIRSLGPEVVSSADLYQAAFGTWTAEQLASHERAADGLVRIVGEAFAFIGERLGQVGEWEVRELIRRRFAEAGLETEHGPIVAVNANSGNPHYEPTPETSRTIHPGDWVLIDLWAREPDGFYADITWVGYAGEAAPDRHQAVFRAVTAARDRGFDVIREAYAAGRRLAGHEVDRAARDFLGEAGYGDYFSHRLGHSLGRQVHANTAHLDDLETRDTRTLVEGLGFTIEPGVYLPEFGVRSEVDVYFDQDGPRLTTAAQREIVPIGPDLSGQWARYSAGSAAGSGGAR